MKDRIKSALIKYLKANGLKPEDFAKKQGFSKRLVSSILNGNFNGSIETFVKLNLAMGRTPYLVSMDLEEYATNSAAGIPDHILLAAHAEKIRFSHEIEEVCNNSLRRIKMIATGGTTAGMFTQAMKCVEGIDEARKELGLIPLGEVSIGGIPLKS